MSNILKKIHEKMKKKQDFVIFMQFILVLESLNVGAGFKPARRQLL